MIVSKGRYPEGYYKFNNIDEIDIKKLEPGDEVLILDTSNYRISLPNYPHLATVKEVTDYPCVWLKADGKEWELYESQIGIYSL